MDSFVPRPNGQSAAPLLCLGMARTGTASLAEALRILGFEKIHHGLQRPSIAPERDVLDRACDATFPVLPSYTNKPFTRDEWDQWLIHWDVVSDMASFFAKSLIPAYPDARVIVVERHFESWFKSWVATTSLWAGSPMRLRMMEAMERRTSVKAGIVPAKYFRSWVGTMDLRLVVDKDTVRKAYLRHCASIRETGPSGQLLDFKVNDGWAPLCAFFNKPVPGVPFPHINDSKAFDEYVKGKRNGGLKRLAKTFVPGGRRRVELQNQRETEALMKQI